MNTKPCRKCGSTDRRKPRKNQTLGDCRACARAADAKRSEENPKRWSDWNAAYKAKYPGKRRLAKAEWESKNPEKVKSYSRKHLYGISNDHFHALLKSQSNACAVCLEPFTKTPQVDHNHTTSEIRGLLCLSCNLILGHAKDNPDILDKAIAYLGPPFAVSATTRTARSPIRHTS